MPFVTADSVNVHTPSAIIVICPSTNPVGGVMMFVAVVPVTWKIGPGATVVAAAATAADMPNKDPVGLGSCWAFTEGTSGPKSAGSPASTPVEATCAAETDPPIPRCTVSNVPTTLSTSMYS